MPPDPEMSQNRPDIGNLEHYGLACQQDVPVALDGGIEEPIRGLKTTPLHLVCTMLVAVGRQCED